MNKVVVIVGLPAVGKSTVGPMAAQELGVSYSDSDQEIERTSGKSISEIFRVDGEAEFRRWESELLRKWLAESKEGGVLSTGGGILESEVNREMLEGSAQVVWLAADEEVLANRLAQDEQQSVSNRPLLKGCGGDRAKLLKRVEELAQRRIGWLRESSITVWTEFGDPTTASEAIVELLKLSEGESPVVAVPIRFKHGERTTVVIGTGIVATTVDLVNSVAGRSRRVVVTDDEVNRHWAERILKIAEQKEVPYCIRSGESSKRISTVEAVADELVRRGCDRSTVLVGFGGGVVGDVTGFVASIFMRGARLVHIPTTLLAQVDSAVGGKTGVNIGAGKNILGTIYPAERVVCDTDLLKTVPSREYSAGLAEVVKYGIISSEKFFNWLEKRSLELIKRDDETLREVVQQSVLLKARLVVEDQDDRLGLRAILNFGHTVGHAIEKLTGYSEALHGEAVSVGMVQALKVGERLGFTPTEIRPRVMELLRQFNLPREVEVGVESAPSKIALNRWSFEEWRQALCADKKMSDGRLGFIVAESLGKARVVPLRVEYLLETMGVSQS